MTDERQNNGRRATDGLFSRWAKIIGATGAFALILLALAFKMYAQSEEFPRVKADVDSLKIVVRDVPKVVEQVNRIDARVAEMYCASLPVTSRAGCR